MNNDIVIIGAGPSGLTTALFLAKAGIPHILIEKSAFPREKICGESYDGKVFHILKRVHPDWPNDLINKRVLKPLWAYELSHSPDWRLPVSFSQQYTPRLQGRRSELDQAMLQHLLSYQLTDWRPQTTVDSISKQGKKWGMRLSKDDFLLADLVVYAAGHSHTKLNPEADIPKKGKGLLYSRIHLQTTSQHSKLPNDHIQIRFIRKPIPACLVVTPLWENTWNVGLGIRKKDFHRLDVPLSAWLKQLIVNEIGDASACRMEKPAGAYMNLHHYASRLSGTGWMVVGSAAVEVNPVTGMGVGNAMRTGELAAQSIIKTIEAKKPLGQADLSQFDRKLKHALRSEIRFSQALTWLQFRAVWLGYALPFVWRSHSIRRWLQQPDVVSNFLNPSFFWRK